MENNEEGRGPKGAVGDAVPRFHPNAMHVASGPYDLTITWIERDPTRLTSDVQEPREGFTRAISQSVLSYGAAKAMIPLLVRAISEYEARFGVIPSPGFEEMSKE